MNAILATTDDFMLALDGTMPWTLSDDFKEISKRDMSFFRKMTKGANIVMGFNTWKSMGEKPLPGRGTHYIITKKKYKSTDKVKFLNLGDFKNNHLEENDLWCIGGAMIYNELIPYCKNVYWNEIHLDKEKRQKLLKRFSSSSKLFLDDTLKNILKTRETSFYIDIETILESDKNGSYIMYHNLYNLTQTSLNKIK